VFEEVADPNPYGQGDKAHEHLLRDGRISIIRQDNGETGNGNDKMPL
jgi:hypothetical protein